MSRQAILAMLAVMVIVTGLQGYAQTNTFPSSGNVGIGTTLPAASLEQRRLKAVLEA